MRVDKPRFISLAEALSRPLPDADCHVISGIRQWTSPASPLWKQNSHGVENNLPIIGFQYVSKTAPRWWAESEVGFFFSGISICGH